MAGIYQVSALAQVYTDLLIFFPFSDRAEVLVAHDTLNYRCKSVKMNKTYLVNCECEDSPCSISKIPEEATKECIAEPIGDNEVSMNYNYKMFIYFQGIVMQKFLN